MCPVADVGLRQTSLPETEKRAAPAVRVPAEPVHDGQDVLFTVSIGPDHHQHALVVAVQTGRETTPVGP